MPFRASELFHYWKTLLQHGLKNKMFLFQTNGLISALGGSLGLFTGIAIIMIFEILELCWDLFFNIWTYMTAGNPRLTRKLNN